MKTSKRRKKEERKKKKERNKEFAIVTYVFLAMFIAMTGYFIYFVQVKSPDFINSPYNARLDLLDEKIVRGDILASDGTVLAETQVDAEGNEYRVYPYGTLFSHAVGYADKGKSGVELDANFYLLNSHAFIVQRLTNEIMGNKNPGDDVVTTLDVSLQQTCYQALGNYDGAVICIEPSTGKILSMVSKPDFDPNTITQNWDDYVAEDSESTVLLNRATQGLYAPGSTFKMITLLSYLQQNDPDKFDFYCDGSFIEDDYELHCYNGKAHGDEDLMDAFANSCNSAFSKIGLSLDIEEYDKTCKKLLFNQTLPTKLKATAKSRMTLDEEASNPLIMQTAIGQGETMVSPLHMAMIASAIANDGVLMKPYMIDATQNTDGTIVRHYKKDAYGSIMTKEEAQSLEKYLRFVVTDGTAQSLYSDAYEAYGKTGTAEFSSDKNKDHSWFVGYAKDEDGNEIAVAVVMENVASGSSYAVPATKQIFDAYFSMK